MLTTKRFTLVFLACFFFHFSSANSQPPEIQLANIYHEGVNLSEYLVSEKLDGVRGYWDGEKLITKKGNAINAPKWFTKNFPNEAIEGELWISRGAFEEVSSIVRQEIPQDLDWQKVHFMIFDMPKNAKVFSQRFDDIKNLVAASNLKHLQAVDQFEISSHKSLMKKLDEIVKNGGEGLMLHKKDSLYQAARNNDILKVKKYEDAEALVIGYEKGEGKLSGKTGALLVENLEDKTRFKIGGGFSDEERKNPPKIGSIITYKFYGKTKIGKPRFAVFMRVRNEN